ncbi:MAG: hypothetical protein GY755_25260 [Chloroflexi bacterium]|nr:hypothetical protein [Chloroflexota bacterium]
MLCEQGYACTSSKFCKLDEAGQQLVKAAMPQLQLSARAYHRILKMARTIADLPLFRFPITCKVVNIAPIIVFRRFCPTL